MPRICVMSWPRNCSADCSASSPSSTELRDASDEGDQQPKSNDGMSSRCTMQCIRRRLEVQRILRADGEEANAQTDHDPADRGLDRARLAAGAPNERRDADCADNDEGHGAIPSTALSGHPRVFGDRSRGKAMLYVPCHAERPVAAAEVASPSCRFGVDGSRCSGCDLVRRWDRPLVGPLELGWGRSGRFPG